MHEASIAANLIHNLQGIAGENRLDRIREVRLRIGRMHHIVPEVLRTQFQLQKKRHAMLAKTRLIIEMADLAVRCRQCGETHALEKVDLRCPTCGSDRIEMTGGMEMHIVDVRGTRAEQK